MSSSELITILTRKQICISRDHTDAIKKVFLNSKLVFFGFRTFIPHWSTEIILQKSCPFSWAMNINKRMPNSEMITVLTASIYDLVKWKRKSLQSEAGTFQIVTQHLLISAKSTFLQWKVCNYRFENSKIILKVFLHTEASHTILEANQN